MGAVRNLANLPGQPPPLRRTHLKLYWPENEILLGGPASDQRTTPAGATGKETKLDNNPLESTRPPRGNNDDNLPPGGPPPGGTPRTLKMPQGSSPRKEHSNLPITITFLASTGLAIFTHLQEDVFGSVTKASKILFTFLAMFTGTVGFASMLQNNSQPEEQSFQIDSAHGLH